MLTTFSVFGQEEENNTKEIDVPPIVVTQACESLYLGLVLSVENYELERIENSSDELIYRIWDCKKVIELRKKRDGNCQGIAKLFVTKIKKRKSELLLREFIIDDSICSKLMETLRNNQIETIPNDSEIKNYENGDDGITYKIEVLTKSKYRFYTLWTPSVQDESIPEVRQFLNILDAIEENLKLEENFKIWLHELPIGNYGFCMATMHKKKRKN